MPSRKQRAVVGNKTSMFRGQKKMSREQLGAEWQQGLNKRFMTNNQSRVGYLVSA